MNRINLDRGVVKRIQPRSGMGIYMYKDQPGVYLTADASPVPDKLAAEAGFDVSRLAREKLRKERMAEVMKRLEAEFGDEPEKVVFEKEGFKVASEGQGVYAVYSPDDNRLTDKPLTKKDAVSLVKQLAKMELSDEQKARKAEDAEGAEQKDQE